jgi:hypothetical protein
MIGKDAVVHEQVAAFCEVFDQQIIGNEHVNILHKHKGHDYPMI